MSEIKQYCTFLVDDLFFGIDVLKVQEVIKFQGMTELPLAPRSVRGLINLRGQIVTAIDLRQHLGLQPYGPDDEPMNVVVRNDGETVSFLVDEIGDVIEVDKESFEDSPETVTGITREIIAGVHKLETNLLMILDSEKTVSLLERNPGDAKEAA